MPAERFSRRHGPLANWPPISVRDDAPAELRRALLVIAERQGLGPFAILQIICWHLKERDDSKLTRSAARVRAERLIDAAPWYRVYDVAQDLCEAVRADHGDEDAWLFQHYFNEICGENGIGWQMKNGQVETRGDEGFEFNVAQAAAILSLTHPTAGAELHEAVRDLSRRPCADVTGAIQHAMAALECTARDVTGETSATLGQILSRVTGLIPRPLDVAVEKAWGYASEMGRHLQEGRTPTRDEAELTVGLVAAVATYLARVHPKTVRGKG